MTEHNILIETIDGEPMLSADALSLLFGVPTEDINKFSKEHSTAAGTVFPQTWLQAGRRRAREAAAATGENDILSALSFWAARDRNAIVIPIEEGM